MNQVQFDKETEQFIKENVKELHNHFLLEEFASVLKEEIEIAYEKSLKGKDHYFYFRGIKFLTPIWSKAGLENILGQLTYMIHMLRWAKLWKDNESELESEASARQI